MDLVIKLHDAARDATGIRIAKHLRESADRMAELIKQQNKNVNW